MEHPNKRLTHIAKKIFKAPEESCHDTLSIPRTSQESKLSSRSSTSPSLCSNRSSISSSYTSATSTSTRDYIISEPILHHTSVDYLNPSLPQVPVHPLEIPKDTSFHHRPAPRPTFTASSISSISSTSPHHTPITAVRMRKMMEFEDFVSGRRQSTLKLSLTPTVAV
ncbi:hypothetical protein BZG36_02487 [Bifiguratus adelaidae]|uniref:Uncharacterized protein n=1 Tax=Bifiguratus adelaidae TaxID=1938954 RepID=A0A261Y0W9_9FUNG|nr:hypothetical protein BZG36_02487 [Bifiguratus adelaidae]